MNKQQKNYVKARAALESATIALFEYEDAFQKQRGIDDLRKALRESPEEVAHIEELLAEDPEHGRLFKLYNCALDLKYEAEKELRQGVVEEGSDEEETPVGGSESVAVCEEAALAV